MLFVNRLSLRLGDVEDIKGLVIRCVSFFSSSKFSSHLMRLNIASHRMTTVIIPFVIVWLYHRLQMSNTFYESVGQNWFTLDSVHIHYNWTHEAIFNATEVYAPATYSYHCQHVSSLQKYDTFLVPSSYTDSSANWHITFTDFQVGAPLPKASWCKIIPISLIFTFYKMQCCSASLTESNSWKC